MTTPLDYTIRYEGTQWALYKLSPETDEKGCRKKIYLGTYRHKEKAVQARDINVENTNAIEAIERRAATA